jgi:hypothetical protein
MKKTAVLLLSGAILAINSSIAFAVTPLEVINKVNGAKQQSFTGNKFQKVLRQNLRLESNANIEYVNQDNFNITIQKPAGISGIKYAINSGKSTIYFPDEKLSFTDAVPSGGEMITDTIMGKITNNPALLQSNYNITMKADDEVAGNPTYVIQIQPKAINSENNAWPTPARTFWVSKSNYQVLREDRTWGPQMEAFFSSQYTDYKPVAFENSPNVRLKLPYNVKKVVLGEKKEKVETFFETFKTPDEVEKKLKEKVVLPKYIPQGFRLKEIQVLNFFDTKIFIQKYEDGLNALFITYRTKPNFFLTLVAGTFSLNLLHKMSDLSYHAPYNYMSRESQENLIISFGDLYPADLQKVNNSVNVK